jgi:hypothetical protein
MGPEAASLRREELASDQWELTQLAVADRWSMSDLLVQRLLRWLLGIPADLSWRLSLGRRGFSRAGLIDLTIATLVVGGIAISLPLSISFALASEDFAGHEGSQRFLMFIVPVVLCLCVGGFFIQEFRPAAGTTIALVGVLSVSIALWSTFVGPALGAATAAGVLYRQRKMRG